MKIIIIIIKLRLLDGKNDYSELLFIKTCTEWGLLYELLVKFFIGEDNFKLLDWFSELNLVRGGNLILACLSTNN